MQKHQAAEPSVICPKVEIVVQKNLSQVNGDMMWNATYEGMSGCWPEAWVAWHWYHAIQDFRGRASQQHALGPSARLFQCPLSTQSLSCHNILFKPSKLFLSGIAPPANHHICSDKQLSRPIIKPLASPSRSTSSENSWNAMAPLAGHEACCHTHAMPCRLGDKIQSKNQAQH